jgi:N-acetylglucosaminyldiphosphoundecaprenol N-acetyl-beta-D-mannosaminyltransferase
MSGTPLPPLQVREVLGVPVHATSYADATERIRRWVSDGGSRAIHPTPVHGIMVAQEDPAFLEVLRAGDLVTPDGMPVVWGLRSLGVETATRVYGPTLALEVCGMAEREDISIGFLGGRPDTLERMVAALRERFPRLGIPYAWSPPFRPLDEDEEAKMVEDVQSAGVKILFVGLGCPKQETWIEAHRGVLPIVMIGVGAAFDFIAGDKPQAPAVMQRLGLEWLFRLVSEPRRLGPRYLKYNPLFMARFGVQLIKGEGRR